MVFQSYNLSNPHIEDYTVHGYAATVGWLCVAYILEELQTLYWWR